MLVLFSFLVFVFAFLVVVVVVAAATVVFFKTWFLYVALAILELTLWTRLNSAIILPQPPGCWD